MERYAQENQGLMKETEQQLIKKIKLSLKHKLSDYWRQTDGLRNGLKKRSPVWKLQQKGKKGRRRARSVGGADR